MLVIAAVCMAFTGFWPNQDNPYKSYSLQAMAWLNGRLDLGQDYPWLELAVLSGALLCQLPAVSVACTFAIMPVIWNEYAGSLDHAVPVVHQHAVCAEIVSACSAMR